MIRTIIFDLGNVIVPFDFKLGYARISALSGCPASEVAPRIRATKLVHPFETGQITAEEFVRAVSAALGWNTTHAEFCELWSSVFLPDTLIPESWLAGLRETHRLVLLSNTNPIHYSMIRENYPLLKHFHEYVLSYEVGCAKPEAKIYEEALARAGGAPEACLFIDDMAVNVEAARGHGIDSVLFESADRLEKELLARGIQVRMREELKEV